MGAQGADECPTGYEDINDHKECQIASFFLNLSYDENANDHNADSVCFYCGGCSPQSTRVANYHQSLAKWICKKGKSLAELRDRGIN